MIRLKSRKLRGTLAIVALVCVAASCDAGWVNPMLGTGTTTGTVPSSVETPDGSVLLSQPTALAAIPGGGFYVLDNTCGIYKETNAATTLLYSGISDSCGGGGASGGMSSIVNNPMALGGDGTLYLSGGGTSATYITPDGIAHTTEAMPDSLGLSGLATAPDGTVYGAAVYVSASPPSFRTPEIVRFANDGSVTKVMSIPGGSYVGAFAMTSNTTAIMTTSYNGGTLSRVDLTTQTVTPTPISLSTQFDQSAVAAGPDGSVYLAPAPSGTVTVGSSTYANQVLRIDADNSVTPIAGTGIADPGNQRQTGLGATLNLSPMGLAATPNNGLLISSGHVVYRLAAPSTAPFVTTTTAPAT